MIMNTKDRPELSRRIDASERIWTHYDHAREKHPCFCDKLSDANFFERQDFLRHCRNALKGETTRQKVCADTVLQCEFAEVFAATRPESAVEECYDAIAVLLRVIDVLEGRQPLGNPAPKTPKEPTPPPKQTPPKSCAAPETERKGKTADGNYECPPVDPDCGVMFCRCPGHEPGCAARMMCKDWREYRNRYIRNVNDGLPEYKRPHRDAGLDRLVERVGNIKGLAGFDDLFLIALLNAMGILNGEDFEQAKEHKIKEHVDAFVAGLKRMRKGGCFRGC